MANERPAEQLRGVRLTRAQATRLVKLAGTLAEEAEACAKAALWRGALVLLGSSLEAALLATVAAAEDELRASGALPLPSKRQTPLIRYALGDLIQVARDAGWLEHALPKTDDRFAALSGTVGGAVTFLVLVRNAATHPGNYVTSSIADADFTDTEHMRPTFETCEGISVAVFEKLGEVVDRW